MYYALIVVVIIGVVVYACLKKKRGDIEKPQEKKPDDSENHTEITVKVPTESKGYIVKDGIKKEVTIKYMPQGLQVFDENGNVVVNVTDRLVKYLGVVQINGTNGSITNDELSDGDLWYYPLNIKTPPPTPSIHTEYHMPTITKNGKNILWDYGSYPADKRLSMVLLYGVY
jgi:biopolymer transport protein ExbD